MGGFVSSAVYQLLAGELEAASPLHREHPATREKQASAALQRFRPCTHGLQLQSMHSQAFGMEPQLTTQTGSFAGCLDYIWLSHHWQVHRVLQLPFELKRGGPKTAGFRAIPDDVFPSDHMAIGFQGFWTAT